MRGIPYPGAPVTSGSTPVPKAGYPGAGRSKGIANTYIHKIINPYSKNPDNNLRDLVELDEVGEGEAMEWPARFDANTAKQYLLDFELAIDTAFLYTYIYHTQKSKIGAEEENLSASTSQIRIMRRTAFDGIHPQLREMDPNLSLKRNLGGAFSDGWRLSAPPTNPILHPLPFRLPFSAQIVEQVYNSDSTAVSLLQSNSSLAISSGSNVNIHSMHTSKSSNDRAQIDSNIHTVTHTATCSAPSAETLPSAAPSEVVFPVPDTEHVALPEPPLPIRSTSLDDPDINMSESE